MNRVAYLMLMGCLLLASGCSKEYSDADLVFLSVHEADLTISTPETSLFTETRPNAFLDPRTPERYAIGHIPGALSVPYRNIAGEWESLKGYNIIVVYGNTYNDPLAEAMSKTLMEYGLRDIRTLKGGLEAWMNSGQQITKGRKP
ncbi:MAG: rhodanese-like domain-containing protein [Phycisphaerales bacterium]|nr:rhodanese-like domain-containing protein [Phycisphaerales bacterium]